MTGESMIGASFLRTAVNLYYDPAVLDRDVAMLRDADYHVVRPDASGWLCVADVHRDLARMFAFPEYYGQNWDAFNDCLGDCCLAAEVMGLVMVLTGSNGRWRMRLRSAPTVACCTARAAVR